MSYDYQTERPKLFTEKGQVMFIKIRDRCHRLLAESGAALCNKMTDGCGGGDSWTMMACVDRMVELGEIREIVYPCMDQHRVFVAASLGHQ